MKFNYYILIFLIAFSCKKENTVEEGNTITRSEFSIPKKYEIITPIDKDFKSEVETWKELNNLQVFLNRFENISINEALSSSTDLSELVASLKDSVMPKKFDKPPFKARVNVFYNETLRLADLNTIEDITIEEASEQIEKVIATYSAINVKINSILEEEKLESFIDVNLENVVLDTISFTDITKKSLNKKKLINSGKKNKQ